eukprot:Gb_15118 [translate_table: standard]
MMTYGVVPPPQEVILTLPQACEGFLKMEGKDPWSALNMPVAMSLNALSVPLRNDVLGSRMMNSAYSDPVAVKVRINTLPVAMIFLITQQNVRPPSPLLLGQKV